ncbi:hemerythrin domain-containing protein [Nitrogeniibacter aestuarii]|uniref:hemerythrin domain-containing protein n=1 Tax=Nitrogeniibacter aestuarii TaxID=2815343 RepID=UPI001D126AA7|nr:hemerythrin domain-containing protein [Nitrogeniibacter aestuarii]
MHHAHHNNLLPPLLEHFAAERQLVQSFLDRLDTLFPGLSADGNASPRENRGAFADLLFETIVALEDHASEEEAFMKKLALERGTPIQYERHIEDHAALAEAMNRIVDAYTIEDALDCARYLRLVLQRWRQDHIETFDKQMLGWICKDA